MGYFMFVKHFNLKKLIIMLYFIFINSFTISNQLNIEFALGSLRFRLKTRIQIRSTLNSGQSNKEPVLAVMGINLWWIILNPNIALMLRFARDLSRNIVTERRATIPLAALRGRPDWLRSINCNYSLANTFWMWVAARD